MAEDLAPVPGDVLGLRRGVERLGRGGRAVAEGEDLGSGAGGAGDEVARDGDVPVFGDAEDALVEELVVQAAEADAVVDGVGAVPTVGSLPEEA